jgi:hypothetical protein
MHVRGFDIGKRFRKKTILIRNKKTHIQLEKKTEGPEKSTRGDE